MRSTTARPGFAGRGARRNSSIVMNASMCFVVMVLAYVCTHLIHTAQEERFYCNVGRVHVCVFKFGPLI
jgi:hypothetical protein